MMAAALVLGACGPLLVVPLCAGLVVWLTYRLGRRTGGPWAGLLAAAFVMASPIVVLQSMWPMTDVPVAALWTGAAVAAVGGTRRSAFATGLWTGAAYLVRPNLPALPLVLLAHLALSARGRERWVRIARFGAAAARGHRGRDAVYRRQFAVETRVSDRPRDLCREEHHAQPGAVPGLALAVAITADLFAFVLCCRDSVTRISRRYARRPVPGAPHLYLVYFVRGVVVPRFLLPAIPALLVLMATGMVLGRLPKPWARQRDGRPLLLLYDAFNVRTGCSARCGGRSATRIGITSMRRCRGAVILSIQHSGSVRFQRADDDGWDHRS